MKEDAELLLAELGSFSVSTSLLTGKLKAFLAETKQDAWRPWLEPAPELHGVILTRERETPNDRWEYSLLRWRDASATRRFAGWFENQHLPPGLFAREWTRLE